MRSVRMAWGFAAAMLLTLSVATSSALAGPPDDLSQVMDINTTSATASSSPGRLTTVGNTVYFSADDGVNGRELWKTDGVTTSLVKDINPNSASSNPAELTGMGGILYFSADDGSSGLELWRSDGTEAGTQMVKDINITPNTAAPSSPSSLTPIGSTLFFVASNFGDGGRELYKTDGTETGTVRVDDINPGLGDSLATSLARVGNTLYFAASTSGGPGDYALFRSDGSSATFIEEINNGGDEPTEITEFDGEAFFRANDGTNGFELWRSDGTALGTEMVQDLNTGGSSFPVVLTPVGDTLFFQAVDTPTVGRELWKYSAGSMSLVKNINEAAFGQSVPLELFNLNGTLLFRAGESNSDGDELWRSDGTDAGTTLVKDIDPAVNGNGYPGSFTAIGGTHAIFTATDSGGAPNFNSELWITDGTEAGTRKIEDINPTTGGLNVTPPPTFAVIGSTILFKATADPFDAGTDPGGLNTELWKAADTIAPNTTIDSGPADGATVDTATQTFGFSSDDPPSTFQCRTYPTGGSPPAFAPCSGPSAAHTTGAHAAGTYTFEVRATDLGGNADPTPATRTYTVPAPPVVIPPGDDPPGSNADKTPPETRIDKKPDRKTMKRKAKFAVSSNEPGSTFECALDGKQFKPCKAKPKFKVEPGKHRLEVRAIDAAGNVDPTPAAAKWKVKRSR